MQFWKLFWHIWYWNVRQSNFVTMRDRLLLQSTSGSTKCDRLLLQSALGIKKCDSYYKVRRNTSPVQKFNLRNVFNRFQISKSFHSKFLKKTCLSTVILVSYWDKSAKSSTNKTSKSFNSYFPQTVLCFFKFDFTSPLENFQKDLACQKRKYQNQFYFSESAVFYMI